MYICIWIFFLNYFKVACPSVRVEHHGYFFKIVFWGALSIIFLFFSIFLLGRGGDGLYRDLVW